jgi:peptidoglycan/xylan/chitin deacetylase (PgdA/CDA1 family)
MNLCDQASAERTVFLTFDDGPHAQQTDRILRTLNERKIVATFFVIGKNALALPQIVSEIAAAGHRVGNHSYSHHDLTKLSAKEIESEIIKTEKLIAAHLGREKLLRPPYGAHNPLVDQVAKDLGYQLCFWNVDTLDWKESHRPAGWVSHGLAQFKGRENKVVLNHDVHESTADHLDFFISEIIALGPTRFEMVAGG